MKKKLLAIIVVVVALLAVQIPAVIGSAAEWKPSIEQKDVTIEKNVDDSVAEIRQPSGATTKVEVGELVVTPYTQKDKAVEDIKQRLESAMNEVTNPAADSELNTAIANAAKKINPSFELKNVVVSDVIDVDIDGTFKDLLKDNQSAVVVTFVLQGQEEVKAVLYKNPNTGKWEEAKIDSVNTRDGGKIAVTVEFNAMNGPVIFLKEAEVAPQPTTEPTVTPTATPTATPTVTPTTVPTTEPTVTPTTEPEPAKSNVGLIIGIIAGAVVLIGAIIIVIVLVKRKKDKDDDDDNNDNDSNNAQDAE